MKLVFATGPVQLDEDGKHLRRELGRALTELLEVPVEVNAEKSYGALAERVAKGEAGLAWLPPATFVRAFAAGTIRDVLSAERVGGSAYQAALFVRADSPFRSLESLRGKRVAWVDKDSCAGFLFPALELQVQGFAPAELFDQQSFLESHSRVVRAVHNGDVEAGATYVQLPMGGEALQGTKRGEQPLEQSSVSDVPPSLESVQVELSSKLALVGWAPFVAPNAMRPLLVSRSIPSDALCLTDAVPSALRDTLLRHLLATTSNAKLSRLFRGLMNADRFVVRTADAYDAVRTAMQAQP